MYAVRKSDGTLSKDYSDILNEQYSFYKDLYSKDESVVFSMTNSVGVQLDGPHKLWFDEPFTQEELYDAVMTLKSGKCPGPDGLSLAFYRTFWNVIKEPLTQALHMAVRIGQLNPSARRGIINLIPKRKGDETLVKHWRPISLLCYDFKIYAKMLANRMETATDLIGKQQNGFIKGRSLLQNIATTREVIAHLNKGNNPGVIAVIDFEKCFDRINHNSIKSMFKYFNFGDGFISMLMLLYNGLELCTINNGWLSNLFVKERGINQGCPASPLVYSFCGEILNHLLQLNKDVKGIPFDLLKNFLSQFADDTCAFLKFERLTIENFSSILLSVEKQMGLKVSYEKTTMYRVGSLQNSDASIYTTRQYKWSSAAIDTLGVHLNCDGSLNPCNFEDVIVKLKSVCNSWINRKLTLTGRILIVNTLMGSLFIYKMLSLENMPMEYIKKSKRDYCQLHLVG